MPLIMKKTINGQPVKIRLTPDTGTGAPVGSLIAMYKKSSPSGYLYCDGSTFDETKYPALYQYLGSNVLPDYRECVAVGAEQNTTDTIASHDVYTEGQFKDDQLQEHSHNIRQLPSNYASGDAKTLGSSINYTTTIDTINQTGRSGTTTHGKQKAVFIYIKATSGLTENQQENVLNTINENLSYSTTEHKTGKKWIDGKDIWSVTVDFGALPNAMVKTVNFTANNIDKITKIDAVANRSDYSLPLPYASMDNTEIVRLFVNKSGEVAITTNGDLTSYSATVTLEYTKTTDV